MELTKNCVTTENVQNVVCDYEEPEVSLKWKKPKFRNLYPQHLLQESKQSAVIFSISVTVLGSN